MSKVGDLRGNVDKLKSQLRPLRYPLEEIDDAGLETGKPSALLPILHYIFLGFSKHFASYVEERGYELHSKNDMRFVELVYKCLRTELDYRPQITTTQFFAQGFAERKVIFLQDIVRIARNTHNDLCAKNPKLSTTSTTSMATASTAPPKLSASTMATASNALPIASPPPIPTPMPQWPSDLNDTDAPITEQKRPSQCDDTSPRQVMADAIRTMQEARATTSSRGSVLPEWTDEVVPNKPPKPLPMPALNGSFSPPPRDNSRTYSVQSGDDTSLRAILSALEESLQTQMEAGFQRMESMMTKSFQDVTARMTVLEGELKILSSRLADTGSHERPFPSTSSSFYSGNVTAQTPLREDAPRISKASAPSQSTAYRNMSTIDRPRTPSVGASVVSAQNDTPENGADQAMDLSVGKRDVKPAWESTVVPSTQETELLISQLTAKFRDTQELLDKARKSG